MAHNKNQTPAIDAGYGLIYRLNWLWGQADAQSLKGELDQYNLVLDRLYVNLLWKNPMVYKYKKDGRIYTREEVPDEAGIELIDMSLSKLDTAVYNKFKQKIRLAHANMHKAIKLHNRKMYNQYHAIYYNTLLHKDIWLRKLMSERKLYLKEFEFDASRAMYGG